MKMLILGYSDLVKRKVIPAIKKLKNIKFDIASVSKNQTNTGHEKWYKNYLTAIEKSNADVVYVSLVNSKHFTYAMESLNRNKNVIVDKPLCLKLNETKKLINTAKKKKLLVAEALVFAYHQQFKLIQSIIKKKNIKLNNIIMQFCIPKPKKNNFKLYKKFGGGCFNDMSPYAAAMIRFFFKSEPLAFSHIAKNTSQINESFNLAISSKDTNFFGIFSHNSEYKNNVNFLSKTHIITAERFSAPPSDINLIVNIRNKNKLKKILVKKNDMFLNFFREYFLKLRGKKILFYHKRIMQDSILINKLKIKRKLI